MKQIELFRDGFSIKKLITICFVVLVFIMGCNAYADDDDQLKIVKEDGTIIYVYAEVTDRIEDIRERIKDKTGISVDKQKLYFCGNLLEDDNTLRDYSVQVKYNEINLWTHNHEWVYELYVRDDQEKMFLAYCLDDDCRYNKKNGENLDAVFIVEDNGYTGEAFDLICFDNHITGVTGARPSPIYYEGRNNTVYDKSTNAPIDAGEYTASITLGGISATLYFLIDKNVGFEPQDVISVNETIQNKNDGKLINVDSSMEYRKDNDDKYISIEGNTVDGLVPGTYYVRYKESTNYKASNDCELIVGSGSNLLSVSVPSNQVGYELSVSNSSVEYDGSSELLFKLKDGYYDSDLFSIKINGNSIELDKDNKYIINDIKDDLAITVDGVKEIEVSNENHSSTKALTCEQQMNSDNWTWSEEKKACVYKVSITSAN